MGRKPKWSLKVAPYMETCFGQGEFREDPNACPCPPACKPLCDSVRFEYGRAPRVERGMVKKGGFTPIANVLLRKWTRPVPAEVRLTYLQLVSWTRPGLRWIFRSYEDLARDRGIGVRTFRQHAAELERLRMILRVPRRTVIKGSDSSRLTVVVLDLPEWLLPIDAVAAEDEEAVEEEDADGDGEGTEPDDDR